MAYQWGQLSYSYTWKIPASPRYSGEYCITRVTSGHRQLFSLDVLLSPSICCYIKSVLAFMLVSQLLMISETENWEMQKQILWVLTLNCGRQGKTNPASTS